MKISVEKSCSIIFSKKNIEKTYFDLRMYGNKIESQKDIKFLGIKFVTVRSILKLKYDTPSNILHQEAYNKLKILTISNRLCELSERYIRAGLKYNNYYISFEITSNIYSLITSPYYILSSLDWKLSSISSNIKKKTIFKTIQKRSFLVFLFSSFELADFYCKDPEESLPCSQTLQTDYILMDLGLKYLIEMACPQTSAK
ncbi:hypothetical protein BpHYR1_052796, partial [Brachionus plicatilis]